MQPWKPSPWLTTHHLLESFKERKKDCCQPWVASDFTECFTELGCNWAHASTALWISLGKWLHIRAISQEKCKCCAHLRNTVILSVRGSTLVPLVVHIYIYLHIYEVIPICHLSQQILLETFTESTPHLCLLTSYLIDFEIWILYSEP